MALGITEPLYLTTVRYSKEHCVPEPGSVCVLKWSGGRHLVCWVS
jgi:hypothetical protein